MRHFETVSSGIRPVEFTADFIDSQTLDSLYVVHDDCVGVRAVGGGDKDPILCRIRPEYIAGDAINVQGDDVLLRWQIEDDINQVRRI